MMKWRSRIGTRVLPRHVLVAGGSVVGLVLCLSAAAAAPSGAEATAAELVLRHTYLTRSVPAEDAVVRGPVSEVRLAFSTPVQRALSTVTVTGSDGYSVPTGGVDPVPDAGENEIRVVFRESLAPGRYTVQWRTAGPDDHPVQGDFTFEVAADIPGAPADRVETGDESEGEVAPGEAPGEEGDHAGMDHEAPPTGQPAAGDERSGSDFLAGRDARVELAARWLFYLTILGMIGTVTFRMAVVRPLARLPELVELSRRALASTRNLGWILAVLALVVLPLRLLLQSTAIFGGIRPGQLGTIVFETSWGTGWLLHGFFVLLFIAGLVGTGQGGRRARGWTAMAVGALGVAFVPAVSGHAIGAEEARAIVLASTFVHVLAGGIWLGGLMALLVAGLPALRRGGELEEGSSSGREGRRPGFVGLSSMVNAFSRVAVLAVGLLVASGVITAWVHLGSIGDLIQTAYGRTFAIKVAIALCAFALGFYNWKVVRPSLRDRQERGLLRIPASIELFIGLLVLVITAVLVSQSLP